nr:MAG TPA: hypothetical protein [Caudoviricetes sp.]
MEMRGFEPLSKRILSLISTIIVILFDFTTAKRHITGQVAIANLKS